MSETSALKAPAAASTRRVLIVDDCAISRALLRIAFEADGRLAVVGEAASATEARKAIRRVRPDVLTLDIEMPGMDGLAFLQHLMALDPLPVVMISGATKGNSEATIQALSMGAIDCLLKPESRMTPQVARQISDSVYAAASSKVTGEFSGPTALPARAALSLRASSQLVLIGASTGGIAALEQVLPVLAPKGPPVVIAQHIPTPFLESLVERMDRKLPQSVSLAQGQQKLKPGQIVFAPAETQQLEMVACRSSWHVRLMPRAPDAQYCPSINHLFCSAIPRGAMVAAVILTGLGTDGANGLLGLRKAGAMTIGQDEGTSAVYGMPKEASRIGAVRRELPVQSIGNAIRAAVEAQATGQPVNF